MKFIICITLLLTLSGCQTIMEQHKKDMAALCTYEGAYSKGVEHGENGSQSQASQSLSSCESGAVSDAMRGYNEGYASVTQSSSTSGADTIGGLLGQVFGTKINNKNNKAKDGLHMCEIDVFTDTFSAKGKSRGEAIYNAKSVCTTSRDDDFFCKDKSKYKCKKLY